MQNNTNTKLILALFAFSLTNSAHAISFRDYYYGNASLGIPPSHELKLRTAHRNRRRLRFDLPRAGLTDLEGLMAIPGIEAVHTIDLSRNQLTEIPESISRLPNLKTLFLGNNQIAAIPDHIANMRQLQILDLSENQLTTIPQNVGTLTKLTSLNLDDNQIAAFPNDIIPNMHQLRDLKLSGNQLTSVPESIGALARRRFSHVYLYNNPIPLTEKQLCQQLNLPIWGSALLFKSREQETAEHNLFLAIRKADAAVVEHIINSIQAGIIRPPLWDIIAISKIRDPHGNNLLHAAIQDLAKQLSRIAGQSATAQGTGTQKAVFRAALADRQDAITDRYMKVISVILSCGEDCVQDMLFTPNAEHQQVIDAIFAKLGPNSPVLEAIIAGLPEGAVKEREAKEREEKLREESSSSSVPTPNITRPKRGLEESVIEPTLQEREEMGEEEEPAKKVKREEPEE